jgi:hypothetical protein
LTETEAFGGFRGRGGGKGEEEGGRGKGEEGEEGGGESGADVGRLIARLLQ